jgi:predicted nucleotide-binding protein
VNLGPLINRGKSRPVRVVLPPPQRPDAPPSGFRVLFRTLVTSNEELLSEIAEGVEAGEQTPLTPLVRKAVRLAARLGLESYAKIFQWHLEGSKKPKGTPSPEASAAVALALKDPDSVTRAFLADRQRVDGNILAHPLHTLEELHTRALQSLNEVSLDGLAEREHDLREILQRVRNRINRFVIEAETLLSKTAASQSRMQPQETAMSIQEDAALVVQALAGIQTGPDDPRRGRHNVQGGGIQEELREKFGLDVSPDRINDAVALLERSGYVKTMKALGTRPFDFRGVELTPEGRHKHEQEAARIKALSDAPAQQAPAVRPIGSKIFIGHGGSAVWRDLKDFLRERLNLEHDEFNREPTAGQSTKERLQRMLDDAAFAFLVMTAEDERADGTKVARANVIHEVGLFQGRLGFERAIVLLEDECDEFSNIAGITQIRFPKGNIGAKFEEIRRVLEREGLLPK